MYKRVRVCLYTISLAAVRLELLCFSFWTNKLLAINSTSYRLRRWNTVG